MNYETLIDKEKDQIGYIILNRPDRLNSFDIKLGEELHHILKRYSEKSSIRAVVIKGTGKGFCGGGDVKEMFLSKNKSHYLRDLTKSIHKCIIQIRSMEKPVIGVINGSAYGAGLSLAIACDILIAAKGIMMGTAFIGIGLAPGCGTQFFTNMVGYQKACEYILTSKTFNVDEAKQLGFINIVVEREKLDKVVEEFVSKFRILPPIAVGKAKMLINKSLENDMKTHLELEGLTAAESAKTRDFNEGITAFIEKRKPIFKGK